MFSGGFVLSAAEAICDADLDALGSLLDKSLLDRDGDRFSMLDTVREFAQGRLEPSGDADEVLRRHAEYFLTLARAAKLSAEDEGEQRHDIVIGEQHNIRAALDWAGAHDVELAIELAVALENFWAANAQQEGMRRFSELLRGAGDIPPALRARALRSHGSATYRFGDFEAGRRLFDASLAEFRRLADERGIAQLLMRLAVDAARRGDSREARSLAEQCLSFGGVGGRTKAGALAALGRAAHQERRHEEAVELFQRSLEVAEQTGFVWWRVNMLLSLAELLLEVGRLDESEARAREALPAAVAMGDRMNAVFALVLLARLAAGTGRVERAGRIWGAVEAEEARAPIHLDWTAEREPYAESVLAHAGPELERGREHGRRLALDEAVELALAET